MERLINKTKEKLGPENCAKFDDIKWNDHGGTNEESLAEYLVEFGKLFEERVKMLVDRVTIIFVKNLPLFPDDNHCHRVNWNLH